MDWACSFVSKYWWLNPWGYIMSNFNRETPALKDAKANKKPFSNWKCIVMVNVVWMALLWFYIVAAILVAAWDFPSLLALHTEFSEIEESMACFFQCRIKWFHMRPIFFFFYSFLRTLFGSPDILFLYAFYTTENVDQGLKIVAWQQKERENVFIF